MIQLICLLVLWSGSWTTMPVLAAHMRYSLDAEQNAGEGVRVEQRVPTDSPLHRALLANANGQVDADALSRALAASSAAELNAPGRHGLAPLALAAHAGNARAIDALLAAGAAVNPETAVRCSFFLFCLFVGFL